MSPYRMYLFRKYCTTLGSLSKERLYDRRCLYRTRFKTHTVVEDEARILVREVLVVDVRFPNATMSDINGGLQTFFFSSGLSAPKNHSTHPIQVDIEDRVDQRRFPNAALEPSEHIVESINGI